MRVELRAEARNDLIEGAAFYEAQREDLDDYFINCLFSDLPSLETWRDVAALGRNQRSAKLPASGGRKPADS